MSALEPFRKGPPQVRAESFTVETASGRPPFYLHGEAAYARRMERMRSNPPRPTSSPPAPILPPAESDEPLEPAMPGLLGVIVALITLRRNS